MGFIDARKAQFAEARKLGARMDTGRRSGRTLGIALWCLGTAMKYPRQEVKFEDHSSETNKNVQLFNMAREVAQKLELEGFEFNRMRLSVKYDLGPM